MSAKPEIKCTDSDIYIKLNNYVIIKREEVSKGLMDYYAPTVYIDWAENGEIVGIEIH